MPESVIEDVRRLKEDNQWELVVCRTLIGDFLPFACLFVVQAQKEQTAQALQPLAIVIAPCGGPLYPIQAGGRCS